MAWILCEADAPPMVEIARKRGISRQTSYLLRKRFGKREATDLRRLRDLDQEKTS